MQTPKIVHTVEEGSLPPSGSLVQVPGADYALFFGFISTDQGRTPAIGRFQNKADQPSLEITGIFLGEDEMNATLSVLVAMQGAVVTQAE